MAKLFTGDQLKTIATREWVEKRTRHSGGHDTDSGNETEGGDACPCEPIPLETINRILKETGFPTNPLP